jgi:hypothetical protein
MFWPADLVFSSVLREFPSATGMSRIFTVPTPLPRRVAGIDRRFRFGGAFLGPPRPMVRTLRTAEQARAFYKYLSS